ncbi:sigma-70 family RNA polymerase sigma factor [Corynebacterium guaraldiae]|uniref:Sigma-70 family RNA polymerase sigma factor n=1 Tax=Corynebacterium guaraldiae TaxID=3051103 RepID=A0ABY3CRP2_9CORY|nr:sigma-70 family RNA polymerase sigma factor [Corynebacterium guaraldiae]TRX47075.1 sigma-70 family RNA polymerase sigma factor [Corynebacterium guaraldiae]TRX53606.1 sigma-70 family RNA polymerase sigma factor [Corynebacterium guaraldiae]
MVFNQTRTLKVRFERDNSTERYPCEYYTVEVSADEVAVMVEKDYQQRAATAEEPSVVERRDPNVILELEVVRREYNNAKSHYRNTTYRASTPRDETAPVSVIESELSTDGYLAGHTALADPADDWTGVLAIWDAINSLQERERDVLIAVKLHGLTQSEVATQLGVSQPMVAKILKCAVAKLEAMLR